MKYMLSWFESFVFGAIGGLAISIPISYMFYKQRTKETK